MEVTEQIVYKAAMAVNGTPIIKYQGQGVRCDTALEETSNMTDVV